MNRLATGVLSILLPVVAAAACAPSLPRYHWAANGPGGDIEARFLAEWNCDPLAVKRQTDSLRAIGRAGKLVPQVGWKGCDVLSRSGYPLEASKQQTEYGRYATWWLYQSQRTLLRLERRDVTWVVTYVGT